MKNNFTHITIILDRTGSMEPLRDDTIGGFNTFLKSQKETPGTATMTLVQFDSQDPYEVIHQFRPIDEIPELTRDTFVPRASTPLLDALGRGIIDLEARLEKLDDKERPAKIIFAIITDGQENASREFRKKQIESMIRAKTKQDSWQFVFLSSDLAAIDEARALGLRRDSTLLYAKDAHGTGRAWKHFSDRAGAYRSVRDGDFSFEEEGRSEGDV